MRERSDYMGADIFLHFQLQENFKHMKNKNGIFWSIAFIVIFLLTQDYLFTKWKGRPSILGFPIWIFWFAIVHLLFILVFYFFAKKYWKE